jgi:high affinity Mn2+ porin
MKICKILLFCTVFTTTAGLAENYPDLSDEDEFSLMGALSGHGLHDLKDEGWNAYSQATYISSFKDAFPAAYTNLNGTPNSLSPYAEHSFTATFTSYVGLKAWKGAEFYAAPEMISELPLSGLKGLGGGIQNSQRNNPSR